MKWRFAAIGVVVVTAAALLITLRPAAHRWAESRSKLIDDCNDDNDQNLIGGQSFVQTSGGGRISAARLRSHSPAPGDGVCALTYDLADGTSAAWGTSLNDLDISAAKTVRFWLNAQGLPLPELRLELADGLGHSARSVLPHLRHTRGWQHLTVPLEAFKGVDPNRLKSLTLHLSASKRPLMSVLDLDQFEFVGPTALFFRSLKDNLYGFPRQSVVDPHSILTLPSDDMLRAIAADTWGYFRDIVDHRHHLPLNYIQTRPTRIIGDYTSTTDVSMYLMSVVSARDFDLISYTTAVARIRATLTQLEQLPRWKGFFYNYYSTTNLQVTNQYISSVDNGWLAVALVVVRQAFPELAPPANRLIEPMDFQVFYDTQNGQIRLGYEIAEKRFAPYHYGLLATEARIISVVAIGKGDIPADHWFRIYRTLPKEWTWQRQIPNGAYRRYFGHDVFNGYYTYSEGTHAVPFVPSWGGSLFEFLMPTLVIDERTLAPKGLGLNDQRAVDLHIHYALNERGLPVWGLSPCATPKERHGGYSEFGVAALGSKGYTDEAIVTPHVSMLALAFAPEAAQENIRRLLSRYAIYGPYGLYDSVDAKTGDVAYRYLALDQGMSLIALNNYLNDGAIQRRFHADPIMKRVEPLLKAEDFFESEAGTKATIRPVQSVR